MLWTKVFHLEDLADFELAFLGIGMRVRAALDPVDRFLERVAFPDTESGHELLGFREWAVGDDAFVAGEADAGALGARL